MLLSFQGAAHAQKESYRYESRPVHSGLDAEAVDMEVQRDGGGILYATRVTALGSTEEVSIRMTPAGRVLSGVRTRSRAAGQSADQSRLRVEGGKAFLLWDGMKEALSYNLPEGEAFAVDGSLLILIRSYPFETDEALPVFMVDFSGPSITVTLRKAAGEKIVVPAGEFDCWRMEVAVNIPVIRPKIIYWVTKMEPHFLVKSIGRRGPFTASYETNLLRFTNEGDGSAR
jgi:hypothetical protein